MSSSNISSSLRLALVLAAMLAPGGCDDEHPPLRYGLPALYLDIEPSDLSVLRNGTFTQTRVPVFVELHGEQHLARISVAGRSSVDDLKKSYNLDFARAYRARTRYRLNAMSRDPTAMRGALAWWVFEQAGFPTPRRRYVAVFVNDDYAGVYVLHETIDEDFFETRGQEPLNIYAARRTLATMESSADAEAAFSSRIEPDAYGDLEELIAIIDQEPTDANRRELEAILDVDSVLRYMAATLLTDNQDGVDNNYVLVRTRQDVRFSVLPWDLDFSFRGVHGRNDGSLFVRNAMMRRFFYADEAYGKRFDCFLEQLGARASARVLGHVVGELAAHITEAHADDPVLSRQRVSLATYIEQLDDRNRSQEKLIATGPRRCRGQPAPDRAAHVWR